MGAGGESKVSSSTYLDSKSSVVLSVCDIN